MEKNRAIHRVTGALWHYARDNGIGVRELSRATGIDASYISKVFQFNKPLSLSFLMRCADAMGLAVKIKLVPKSQVVDAEDELDQDLERYLNNRTDL